MECGSSRPIGRLLPIFAALSISVLVSWLRPSPALAHAPLPPPGWYLLLGGPVAASTHPGLVLGGEASLVCIECVGDPLRGIWAGGYLDGVHDFGTDTTRLSLGPEFGMLILGADTGPLLSLGSRGTDLGWQGRVLITLARIGLYGRGIYLKDQGWLGEFGALWKFDLYLSGK